MPEEGYRDGVTPLKGKRNGLEYGTRGKHVVYRKYGSVAAWKVWVGGHIPDADLVPEVIEPSDEPN